MSQMTLDESRRWCHELMRKAAKNFYYGMSLLPADKRSAMFSLYAWMRHIDDIADDQPDKAIAARELEVFREETLIALYRGEMTHPMFPALREAVQRFSIPVELLNAAIDGQMMDMVKQRYENFDELRRYCYCVASTVGIAAVFIWGFRNTKAIALADHRGVAFQLTNILRDVREDYSLGRVYLPKDDLDRFGVNLGEALAGRGTAGFRELTLFEASRARRYYEDSCALESLVSPDARPTLRVMTRIYGGILDEIQANPLAVLERRVGLSSMAKLKEVARELWRLQVEGNA